MTEVKCKIKIILLRYLKLFIFFISKFRMYCEDYHLIFILKIIIMHYFIDYIIHHKLEYHTRSYLKKNIFH